jgi:hypothetical protein
MWLTNVAMVRAKLLNHARDPADEIAMKYFNRWRPPH